jgi:hypothetical protein
VLRQLPTFERVPLTAIRKIIEAERIPNQGATMAIQVERSYTERQLKEVAYHVFARLRDQHGISFSKEIEDVCTEKAVTAVKENIFVKFKT